MQHLRVRRISARLSGFVKCMREPRFYENPACASVGGDFWFPEKLGNDTSHIAESSVAITICNRCRHREECAEWGINKEVHGIWGGLTARARAPIQRERNIVLREEEDVA